MPNQRSRFSAERPEMRTTRFFESAAMAQQIKHRDRRNGLLWSSGKRNQGSVIVENQQTAIGMNIGRLNLRGPEPLRLRVGVATAFRNSFLQRGDKAISPMEHI